MGSVVVLIFFFQAILFGYFCCTLAFDAELKQRKNFVLITLLLYCEFCAVFYGRESSNRPQCLCWLTKYQVLKLCTQRTPENTLVYTFGREHSEPHRLIKTVNKNIKVFGICFSTSFFSLLLLFLHALSFYLACPFANFVLGSSKLRQTHAYYWAKFTSLVKSFGLFRVFYSQPHFVRLLNIIRILVDSVSGFGKESKSKRAKR